MLSFAAAKTVSLLVPTHPAWEPKLPFNANSPLHRALAPLLALLGLAVANGDVTVSLEADGETCSGGGRKDAEMPCVWDLL